MDKDQYYIGIDIGGTKCAVCLGNDKGKILDKAFFPTNEPEGPQQAIVNFLKYTDELLLKHLSADKKNRFKGLTGIGIACGSPLDPDLGIIQSPAQLPSWKDIEIVRIFREHYDVPTFLDNDANAGACAEFCFGAGRDCKHMVFMTFGTGMGAGLILNGQIYRGTNCYAGEVGHFRLAPDGPIGCRKAGSFEGFCSGAGIAQIAEAELSRFTGKTSLPKNPSTKDVAECAEQGDPLALRIFEISGHYLGNALALIIDLINPERVIIGSIFLRCEKFLRPAMEKALHKEALEQTVEVCKILPAGLGEHVGDYAALSVAYNALNPQFRAGTTL